MCSQSESYKIRSVKPEFNSSTVKKVTYLFGLPLASRHSTAFSRPSWSYPSDHPTGPSVGLHRPFLPSISPWQRLQNDRADNRSSPFRASARLFALPIAHRSVCKLHLSPDHSPPYYGKQESAQASESLGAPAWAQVQCFL